MKIGTKSILFGVHAFWWHPITVLLAWRRLYKRNPRWPELIAIACHDLGYWGCSDIDGPSGKKHPHVGAQLTARIVVFLKRGYWLREPVHDGCEGSVTYFFTLGHSRDAAKAACILPSSLYAADKASIFYDPKWFYLLRAKLSGEITEFKANATATHKLPAEAPDGAWFDWYRAQVRNRPGVRELL